MTDVKWPFLGSEILATNALPERATRLLHEPVYPGVYIPAGIELTAAQRAEAARLWSRRRGVVAGASAAALLGAKWVAPQRNTELIHDNRRPPAGVRVRTDTLPADELSHVGEIVVTSLARTAFDIARRAYSRLAIVQLLDALAHATDVKSVDVEAVAARHPGARGIVWLLRILPLVDGGSESPQETQTRLTLIDAGLPPPTTQIEVRDEYGEFVARIDMGYEYLRVGIEYDGLQHWTSAQQRERDIDRYSALTDLGWVVIRVSSDLLRYRQGTLIARVNAAISAARGDSRV